MRGAYFLTLVPLTVLHGIMLYHWLMT